jgi:hypothetical protein
MNTATTPATTPAATPAAVPAITSAADSTSTRDGAEVDAATIRSLARIRELGPGDGDVVDVVFAGPVPA